MSKKQEIGVRPQPGAVSSGEGRRLQPSCFCSPLLSIWIGIASLVRRHEKGKKQAACKYLGTPHSFEKTSVAVVKYVINWLVVVIAHVVWALSPTNMARLLTICCSLFADVACGRVALTLRR